MKTLLITSLLFIGNGYKIKTTNDTFNKQKEINRTNCYDATSILQNNKIIIKEKCLLTYKGIRKETYQKCYFDRDKYLKLSIITPIKGMISFPFSFINDFLYKKNSLKNSLNSIIYPLSSPFNKPKKCVNTLAPYKLNKHSSIKKEILTFNDFVKIYPNKEIWIGNKNHQYPLELNDDLSYYIPNKLINYFCQNKYNCNLIIYKRDNDKLQKLTTVHIK